MRTLRGPGAKAAATVEAVDPLQLHRPFCPWVAVAAGTAVSSSRSASGSGSPSDGSPPAGKACFLYTCIPCPCRRPGSLVEEASCCNYHP